MKAFLEGAFGPSYRTTLTGLFGLLMAVSVLAAEQGLVNKDVGKWAAIINGAAVSMGLVTARDNKVSSEKAGAV